MLVWRPRDHTIDWCARAKILDRLDPFAVAGHETVVVAVGADHVGQDLRVTGVGLGAAGGAAVPIARRRHRVHRVELVAGRDQGGDEQAPVGLDPDRHLARILRVSGGELVEPGNPVYALGEPPPAQPLAGLILDVHVMMSFRPVHANKDNLAPLTDSAMS
jgi:hypothetical protein